MMIKEIKILFLIYLLSHENRNTHHIGTLIKLLGVQTQPTSAPPATTYRFPFSDLIKLLGVQTQPTSAHTGNNLSFSIFGL